MHSNNDPKLIASCFVDCVKELGHAPKLLRTDCGTENGIAAGIQSLFHGSTTAHIYGRSTANQCIEALWSKLKPALQGWKDFFKELVNQGVYHSGHPTETYAIRMVFMNMIRDTLHAFVLYWNTHRIRQSADCPPGIPDILFYQVENCGTQPTVEHLVEAEDACRIEASITGDSDIDEYFTFIMTESNIAAPHNKRDGLNVYRALVAAAQ